MSLIMTAIIARRKRDIPKSVESRKASDSAGYLREELARLALAIWLSPIASSVLGDCEGA